MVPLEARAQDAVVHVDDALEARPKALPQPSRPLEGGVGANVHGRRNKQGRGYEVGLGHSQPRSVMWRTGGTAFAALPHR